MGAGLAAEPGLRLLLAEEEAVNGAWMGGFSVCNEKARAVNGGFFVGWQDCGVTRFGGP